MPARAAFIFPTILRGPDSPRLLALPTTGYHTGVFLRCLDFLRARPRCIRAGSGQTGYGRRRSCTIRGFSCLRRKTNKSFPPCFTLEGISSPFHASIQSAIPPGNSITPATPSAREASQGGAPRVPEVSREWARERKPRPDLQIKLDSLAHDVSFSLTPLAPAIIIDYFM